MSALFLSTQNSSLHQPILKTSSEISWQDTRMPTYSKEPRSFQINFLPIISIKGQIIADFWLNYMWTTQQKITIHNNISNPTMRTLHMEVNLTLYSLPLKGYKLNILLDQTITPLIIIRNMKLKSPAYINPLYWKKNIYVPTTTLELIIDCTLVKYAIK